MQFEVCVCILLKISRFSDLRDKVYCEIDRIYLIPSPYPNWTTELAKGIYIIRGIQAGFKKGPNNTVLYNADSKILVLKY